MIDLTKTTLATYRQRVYEIYKQLERNPWCTLEHFELCYRRISILNSKINSIRKAIRSSEIQKEEKYVLEEETKER